MAEDESELDLISLAEVRAMLQSDEKERELSYDKRVALEHAKTFAPLSPTKTRELVKKIARLDRISLAHAIKIAEVMPRDIDELRPVFAKDRFTLEKDETETILEAVEKYIE